MNSAVTRVSPFILNKCLSVFSLDRNEKYVSSWFSRISEFLTTNNVFVVEGDAGGPVSNPDGYQDALSKKQRRPQEDERRRKEQGAAVSSTYVQHMPRINIMDVSCMHLEPFFIAVSGASEKQDNHIQDTTTLCQKAGKHEHRTT